MLKTIIQQLRQHVRQINYGHRLYAESSAANIKTAEKLGSTSNNATTSVTKALEGWETKLKEAGVGDIEFNFKCLVAHVLKQRFSTLPTFDKLQFSAEELLEFQRLLEARCARMPLQYILGEWDFMNLTLKTAPTVFIPRPETEEFVHKVIQVYREVKEPIKMLEVGCGSGAMSLAILHALPNVTSTAIERSKAATKLAWENAKLLHLDERFQVFNHTSLLMFLILIVIVYFNNLKFLEKS